MNYQTYTCYGFKTKVIIIICLIFNVCDYYNFTYRCEMPKTKFNFYGIDFRTD